LGKFLVSQGIQHKMHGLTVNPPATRGELRGTGCKNVSELV